MNTSAHITPGPAVKILWTGGWDSSYRVCHLAIVEQKIVAPIYFKSPWRHTTPLELEAIDRLLAALQEQFPEARQRILPLQVFPMDREQDPRDPFIVDHYALQSVTRIGPQYALLARELHRLDLHGVEMCIHVGDHPGKGPVGKFTLLFQNRLERHVEHGVEYYQLAGPAGLDATARVFSRLRFPLHNVTKTQTRDLARLHGFERLLHLTWFCYHPRSGRPCGVCNPCLQAIADDFGWRIGFTGHLRNLIRRQLPETWARIKTRLPFAVRS